MSGPSHSRRDVPRGNGLRALATSVTTATSRVFARRGYAHGSLFADWADIVGPGLAERCLPLRWSGRRTSQDEGGSLLLRVAPGFALELQHLEPLLIERINGYFGYRAVARIKLQQGAIPSGSVPRPKRSPGYAEPPAERAAALEEMLTTVGDETMRDALARLGRAVAVSHGGSAEDGSSR